jgi:hypothetical protein
VTAEPIPEIVANAVDLLRRATDQEQLPHAVRLRILTAVRCAILPKRTPGKKKDNRLDKAFGDYKAGVRGLELYRAHIPRHDKMSRWRRQAEERRLVKNLQKRSEREKKRDANADNSAH